jgi:hypothetical protein
MDTTFFRERRVALGLGMAAGAVLLGQATGSSRAADAAASGAAAPEPPAPGLKYLFRIEAHVAAPIEGGTTGGVARRMIPIIGGRVNGPAFSGEVMPGGADWQTIRADGATEVHAHYLIRASSGAMVEVDNPGIRRGPAEVMKRLRAGEDVDPSLYYFRSTPRFSTSAPEYAFLMDVVCICSGVRRRDAAILDVFSVL